LKRLAKKAAKAPVEGRTRPRVVLVTRKTGLESLVEQQGTKGQAEFFLRARGQNIESFEKVHKRSKSKFKDVQNVIPSDQRRVHVDRDHLDRFLFSPDDIVLVVGQDGLVPNAAKYLSGQLVIGVNPDPEEYDGVLCRHTPDQIGFLLEWAEEVLGSGGEIPRGSPFAVERRTMGVAERDDGMRLFALNEFYVGHQTHQSSKYRLEVSAQTERQSSSGVICSTGTGCTGWARSIVSQRNLSANLPQPWTRSLAWFVREPFPSVSTGTNLNFGVLSEGQRLVLYSEMGEGGVVFADGIEQDHLSFLSGQFLMLGVARQTLNLVVPTCKEE